MSAPPETAQAERNCGTCSLCCKLLGIEELGKKAGTWCPHCAPPHGCTIYDTRPTECRTFSCVWLENAKLPEEWKPTRSKMVLYLSGGGARMIAHVDPGSPDAWRKQPYYDQLKRWARQWRSTGPQVVVRIENRIIAILPDRDVDLGRASEGDAIFIGERQTALGRRMVAERLSGQGDQT